MGAMNELINAAAVERLRGQVLVAARAEQPDFAAGVTDGDALPTVRAAQTGVDGLSLRERADLVSAALISDLTGSDFGGADGAGGAGDSVAARAGDPDADYRFVAAVFRGALADPGFAGWTIWPVSETVTTLALLADRDGPAFDDGLTLLAQLTPRLTSEFAIRRFLEADLDRALAVVETWVDDADDAVRRLASEGTRPFLPWAIRVRSVLARPDAALPILHALHADESDFVRRSVANHLNDLARENADLVVQVATAWMEDPGQNTRWVVRHGLRTLIKKGNPGALALLGFETATVTVTEPTLDSPSVTTPGELGFTFDITNDGATPVRLAIDYVVHYVKSNGTTAGKVFKLTTATLAPGETTRVAKRHGFRPMTTRVHYAGTHSLQPQVNGQRFGGTEFELVL